MCITPRRVCGVDPVSVSLLRCRSCCYPVAVCLVHNATPSNCGVDHVTVSLLRCVDPAVRILLCRSCYCEFTAV
ncbi:hypothetical protein J6590_074522 [Homalodisca vitripennis]|nr:hypothetical protein J6590_074522 [Homalodisca vitripennis]